MGKFSVTPDMKRKTMVYLLVALLLVFAVALISHGLSGPGATPAGIEGPAQTVENLFVDINQDGLVDFLVKGTVILNTGGN